MDNIYPYLLIILGWPITSIVTNYLRHRPKYLKPGVGTQHIMLIGMIIQFSFIGAGIGWLVSENW